MKPIKTKIKLQIKAGQANPAPPVGPALGQHGLNIQDFCMKFNEATKQKIGSIIPAEITVYTDRTFDFILKTSLTSELLKKAANIEKGSNQSHKNKVGKITEVQVKQIAEEKMSDLNTDNLEAAMKIIKGTARQMGIEIVK